MIYTWESKLRDGEVGGPGGGGNNIYTVYIEREKIKNNEANVTPS